MYHSVIGKRLVECVNRRDGTAYTVREFFDTVYVPLFFGSARMLQNVNNSPFDQAITKSKKSFSQDLVKECLEKVHSKVQEKVPDASFFLGGPSAGDTGLTSGQVTAIQIPVSAQDIYASWIGEALGLTLSGAWTLMIDADDVLLTLYDGWAEYRKVLDQTPNLKPLQINTWNGQWLVGQLSDDSWGSAWQPALDKDNAALVTQKWVQIIFALSHHYKGEQMHSLTAYVYSLGVSTPNKTIGFVRLNIVEAEYLVNLYQRIFTVPKGMEEADFKRLYDTAEGFEVACGHTEVGLRALRPRDIFRGEKGVPTPPKSTDAEKRLAFDTYQTWIIAMLNNKDLMPLAGELAKALNTFQMQDIRMKNVKSQMVEELLGKKNRREFIGELAKLLDEDGSNCELFERVVNDLMSLSSENVPLFLTLLRFQYAVAKTKKETTP